MVISSHGDVIVEYADRDQDGLPSASSISRWLVASEDLIHNSPYFRALLDPNKFSEGRDFMKQKADLIAVAAESRTNDDGDATDPLSMLSPLLSSDADALRAIPTLSLSVDEVTQRLGVNTIELFLRVLSYPSLGNTQKRVFNNALKPLPPSVIARLIHLADTFNSPQVVREALKRSGYAYGKGRVSVTKFNQSLLKMSEDRIRHIIYIAHFLDEPTVYQVMTHTLVVLGSKYWINGVEAPSDPEDGTFRWQYFADGLEEELFHRRQYVLNTITDLQAYFLRAYGALEETTGPKPSTTNHPVTVPATSTTIRPREFQCRCGMGNSNACDAFHLGQMVRFFALRTKTIFLGSSLLDPDFTVDSDDEGVPQTTVSAGPPADITAIIASIKQFPDYQIDPNHTGCGVRRRIIPSLDCVERFVGDGRGLLGVSLRQENNRVPLSARSWTNRSLRRAQQVDVRLSRISGIHYSPPSSERTASQEEDARLFFTAKKRHWEA
ncbi:uncharacterized protein ASPGLDRAFT_63896 [Aspergillus glaucus CBS 516.65]|uniref:BTB domain-containing protein n=1 Tax=Aspergillus glaucus CBS 516.65 TaxID=1160497 RepID=A0A1L9VV80_ASPGL|nr:hypothetical protein ASPGLDRAFT_63896 [Aspergillus glaucus CBS 516.65]OJJ87787.1 hypothetical protein ASPGLDRAFT_63896 [Aspergillus glaucus CBS 516.65]